MKMIIVINSVYIILRTSVEDDNFQGKRGKCVPNDFV